MNLPFLSPRTILSHKKKKIIHLLKESVLFFYIWRQTELTLRQFYNRKKIMNKEHGPNNVPLSESILYIYLQVQGISEKCTEAFKFGCRVIFWSIYPKVAAKAVSSVYLSIEFIKKILCFDFITNILVCMCKYILKNIFISTILNDPCFKDKSWSLTLKDDEILSGTLFRIKL